MVTCVTKPTVFRTNRLDQLFSTLGHSTHGIDRQTARLLLLEVNIRRLLVQTNSDRLQLSLQQSPLMLTFSGVQHHAHHVRSPGHGNDLSASALALRGAFVIIKVTLLINRYNKNKLANYF